MKKFYLLVFCTLLLICLYEGYYIYKLKSKINSVEYKKFGTYSTYKKFSEDFVFLEGVNPKNGFISDSKSAVKYAEIVWLQVYGKKIYAQIPFNACLVGDSIWIISGTTPKNTVGGVLEALIRKKDGKVIRISVQK